MRIFAGLVITSIAFAWTAAYYGGIGGLDVFPMIWGAYVGFYGASKMVEQKD